MKKKNNSNSFNKKKNMIEIKSKILNSERETLDTNKNEFITIENKNIIKKQNEELENGKITHLSNLTDNFSIYQNYKNKDNDNIIEIKENINNSLKSKINKYSNCVMWEKIPFISSILPFIGHLIIINSEGKSYDFSSSKFIDINDEYKGNPIKIIKLDLIDIEKHFFDNSIIIVSNKYKKKEFSFCGYNSYSFLAEILNMIQYKNKKNYSSFEVFKYSIKKAKYTSKKMIFINYIFIILMIILIFIIVVFVNILK
jgi:hypothetical protein